MALKMSYHFPNFKEWSEERKKEVDEKILASMQYAGETFVTEAREQPQDHELHYYIDRTGNLRNSIGYYIFKDGVLLKESSSPFGASNLSVLAPYIKPKGYQLFAVAGMDYASYVEAKGYNVITLQADRCFALLREFMFDISAGG